MNSLPVRVLEELSLLKILGVYILTMYVLIILARCVQYISYLLARYVYPVYWLGVEGIFLLEDR